MAWGKRTAGVGQAACLRLHTRGSEGNRASGRPDAAGALPLHAARTIDGETGSQQDRLWLWPSMGLSNRRVDGSEVRVWTLEPSGDDYAMHAVMRAAASNQAITRRSYLVFHICLVIL
jgi:hypothetical protein